MLISKLQRKERSFWDSVSSPRRGTSSTHQHMTQHKLCMLIALEKEWNLLRDVELDLMAQYQFMHLSPTWQISTFWTNNNHSIHLRTLQVEVQGDTSVVDHLPMLLQLLLNMILNLWEVCHNHKIMLSLNTQNLKIKCLHPKCQTRKASHLIIQKCRSPVVVSNLSLVYQWCHLNTNQVLQQEVQLMISKLELMLWKMVAEEACDSALS